MEYLLSIPITYLVMNVLYNLIFSISSLKNITKNTKQHSKVKNSIAVLIPAYKEDNVIIDSVFKASNHNYPKDKFDVIVIADQLTATTILKLNQLDVKVIMVMFDKSSKAKALNAALTQLKGYDISVVLDADNVMKPNFLLEVNGAYNEGSKAMQGQRIAKNEQNTLAQLDAISEGINNNIFRKGHQNLGLSSALIGSAMAFDFNLFQSHMSNINALGGFDKELELSLLKEKIKIVYLPEAQVYDEKISDKQSFSNQRTRWIAAQIRFGVQSFKEGVSQLVVARNIDYFDKVLQFLFLPRLILLGSLFLMTLLSLLLNHSTLWISTSSLLICMASLFLATPRKYQSFQLFSLILNLPSIFIHMVFAIGGYKKAANNFLHTNHQTHEITS